MKKTYTIKGMHCNSCSNLIENKFKDKVNSISVNYAQEKAEIDFNEKNISETEIKEIIKELGYEIKDYKKNKFTTKNYIITGAAIIGFLAIIFLLKYISLPTLQIPDIGENTSLVLLFLAGILTGFHCISMCGGFVLTFNLWRSKSIILCFHRWNIWFNRWNHCIQYSIERNRCNISRNIHGFLCIKYVRNKILQKIPIQSKIFNKNFIKYFIKS